MPIADLDELWGLIEPLLAQLTTGSATIYGIVDDILVDTGTTGVKVNGTQGAITWGQQKIIADVANEGALHVVNNSGVGASGAMFLGGWNEFDLRQPGIICRNYMEHVSVGSVREDAMLNQQISGVSGDILGRVLGYDPGSGQVLNPDAPGVRAEVVANSVVDIQSGIASASAVANITGTSASTIWTYDERYLTSGSNLNIIGTSASTIWTHDERYLTSGSNLNIDVSGLASGSSIQEINNLIYSLQSWVATQINESITEGQIIQIRGNSWNFNVPNLILDNNLIQFVVKKSPSDQDSQAYLKIDNVNGLRILNGQTAEDPTKASLTYSGSVLGVQADASITSVLTSGTWHYGIQYITSGSIVSEPYGGSFIILKDIVRSVQ